MDTLLGAGAESVRSYYITAILRNSLLESNNVTMSYYDVAFGRILCKDRQREREGRGRNGE